ncbi:hypothetical protein SprV_0702317100 [Sparganum proliferum]
MCVVLSCATAARAAVVGALEEKEKEEEEEEEEEEEDGSGVSEEQSELVGGGDDEEETNGGTTVGAAREVQLIRRCPISPVRARNVRWHRGHVGSGWRQRCGVGATVICVLRVSLWRRRCGWFHRSQRLSSLTSFRSVG